MVNFGTAFFASAAGIFLLSVAVCSAENPDWVLKTDYMNKPVVVAAVDAAGPAQLALISSGLNGNFRIGAFCTAFRDKKPVGNMIVVDASRDKCVALALDGAAFKSGDAVYITPAN